MLALAAAVFLLYGRVLRLWWTYDDFHHLRFLLTWRPFWYFFDAAGFREFGSNLLTPLLFFSLDVDRRMFGLQPRLFYCHQLVVLAVGTAALYGVLRLWLPRPWAAAGAWIFVIGPAAASLAPLLMVRHYIEAIVLASLAVGAWAGALRRAPGSTSWRWALISAALYFAACMAKEIVVPLGVLLPFLPSPARSRSTVLSEPALLALPHAAALLLYLGVRFAVLGTLFGGYGFTVAPSGWPRLALELPGKLATELAGGRFSPAAAIFAAALSAGVLPLMVHRRAAALTGLTLLLAVLPVLPVSTRMEPRYAVPVWIVIAVAFAAGCRTLAAAESRTKRRMAATLALLACVCGWWLNRQDWDVRFARSERMSAENNFLLTMKAGDVLRQPLTLAASLKELGWMKEMVFRRPGETRWFQDDLYLCIRQGPLRRVWGYDPGIRRVVDITAGIPALRTRHCSSIRAGAPLQARFRFSDEDLSWDLGPYHEGRYRFVLADGVEAYDMPRSAAFQVGRLAVLPLRIEYVSPAGWITYSPELRLRNGSSRRWFRP